MIIQYEKLKRYLKSQWSILKSSLFLTHYKIETGIEKKAYTQTEKSPGKSDIITPIRIRADGESVVFSRAGGMSFSFSNRIFADTREAFFCHGNDRTFIHQHHSNIIYIRGAREGHQPNKPNFLMENPPFTTFNSFKRTRGAHPEMARHPPVRVSEGKPSGKAAAFLRGI